MRLGLRWYDSFIILALFYLFVIQAEAIWPFTIDDMYITLRYAKQWSLGHGLVWNLNEPPVEGYSNFSFLLLGAGALHFKLNPVFILKGVGIAGLLLSCIFLFLVTRFWFEQRLSLIPCFGLLLYKGELLWAASGLETTLYQALIIGSVYFILCGLGYRFFPRARGPVNKNALFWAGFFMALAGMTRPEAPALMLLFFMLIRWDHAALPSQNACGIWNALNPKLHQHGRLARWKSPALFALPIFLMYLPYFLWRWHYYGFLFPNPVYCKGFSRDSFLVDQNYWQLIWPFIPFVLLALLPSSDKRLYFLCLPSVLYFLLLAHADPIVAFDNRLFLPVFALLLPLVLIGLGRLLLLYTRERTQVFIFSIVLLSFLLAVFFIPQMPLSGYRYFSQNPVAGERLRQGVLHWLDANAHEGDRVVLADSGMIPYYSQLSFVDSYCLNNREMAHYSTKDRYLHFCHRLLNEKPEIIILTSLIEQGSTLYTPADSCLKQVLMRQNNYKLSRLFSNGNADSLYRYELFIRAPRIA